MWVEDVISKTNSYSKTFMLLIKYNEVNARFLIVCVN